MSQGKAKPDVVEKVGHEATEDLIAQLAKRHRISTAIVAEIVRKLGSAERSAIEREIQRGKSRR
ncbi:hypothetical protein [Roseomonas chloroacetimidivorans]|uniref:hypothetical protein n=1 Tax=Roseomonas chloroacetimidivorans TaxID=1766656 RepID=UPI003C731256